MAILSRHFSHLHYLLAAAILLYCLHAAFNIKLSASSVHNSQLAERRGPVPRIRTTDHVHQPSEEKTRKEGSPHHQKVPKVDKRSSKNSLLMDNDAAKEEKASEPEGSAREGGSNVKMQGKANEDLSGSATIADRDAVIQNGIGPQEEIQPSGRKGIDSGENGRNDEVTFSMTVTLDDAPLVGFMVPHILRGCNYPFARKVIFVDSNGESFAGTKLAKELEKLKKAGMINDIKQVNYSPANVEKLYKKVFGTDFNKTYTLHNVTGEKVFQTKVFGNKGFLSYVESVEDCMETKYCVHLDIDIVVNTRHNYSWVREGLDVIDKYDDIVSVSPLCGPPIRPEVTGVESPDSQYKKPLDPRGKFWNFWHMTTRKFLFSREKYHQKLLPLLFEAGIHYETCVSRSMGYRSLMRADLTEHHWTLHVYERHGLKNIHQCVEKGVYLRGNEGHYDAPSASDWPVCI